jgi:hypothetical protein
MTNNGLDHGAHHHCPLLAPPDLQEKALLMEVEAVTVGNRNMGYGGGGSGGSGGDNNNGGNSDGGGTENKLGLLWLMVGWRQENVPQI